MDLVLIFNVIRKHKLILTIGFVLGIVSVFNSLYRVQKVDLSELSKPIISLKARSFTTYETSINLMISEPHFSIGRAGLIPGTQDALSRTIYLAPTYSRLLTSDIVLREVEKETGPLRASITSESIKDSPIIIVTVQGVDPNYIKQVSSEVANAFSNYLLTAQELYGVPPEDRVKVNRLSEPNIPIPLKSRAAEIAILVFMAPLALAIGCAFIIENIRQHKTRQALSVANNECLGSLPHEIREQQS